MNLLQEKITAHSGSTYLILFTYKKALMLDKSGNWDAAHDLVDGDAGQVAAHIHAYLHRKEGDDWNARYWYDSAKQPVFQGTLTEEWEELWKLYA